MIERIESVPPPPSNAYEALWRTIDLRDDTIWFTTPEEYDARYGAGSYSRDDDLIARGHSIYRWADNRHVPLGRADIASPEALERLLRSFGDFIDATKPQAIAQEAPASHGDGTYVKRLSAVDRTLPPPLLLDRIDPAKATILFGPGDIGKGTLASSWITQLHDLGERILILDYEGQEEEWARRISGLAGADILDDIIHVAPMREWGGPIWKHAAEISRIADAEGITRLVIDSAGMACAGTDPAKPEAPLQFGEALQQIGRPSLTLAHVTKQHDARYPYGSVYWHNVPRVSWSFMPKGQDRVLVCRKANNYEKPPAASVGFTYLDHELREVWEKPASWTLEDRIADVLADGGARTPTAIAAVLNEGVERTEQTSSTSVSGTLSRGLKRAGADYRFTVANDGHWTVRQGAQQ
jgi:hypothetical protein